MTGPATHSAAPLTNQSAILALVAESDWMIGALEAVASLGLPDAWIGAGEHEVNRIVRKPGFIQDSLERGAGPLGRSDAFRKPGLAYDPRTQ